MKNKEFLLNALQAYTTNCDDEKNFIQETINFIKNEPNCFDRSNLSGHVTGSAWLLSPDEKKVLLTHHKKLHKWLQLGGHSDGSEDTWGVALREATEESGIAGIQLISDTVFDIDVHIIPNNPKKSEPEHKHYDIRFLLKAPTENFHISDESNALKWVTKQELLTMAQNKEISPAMERMLHKWIKRENERHDAGE